jgi:hypothetical protein
MMKKVIKITGIVVLLILVGIVLFLYKNLHNRHQGYQLDIVMKDQVLRPLRVGFSAVPITPKVPDHWHDKNNDAQFYQEDGDLYTDDNGNGKFDAIWMAGFQNKRPANGIHDELWARTFVIDDGRSRISLTVLDAIGFMHDEIVDVRKSLPAKLNITYSIISSTHTHEAPDLLGLWGEGYFSSGVDPGYMQYVKDQSARSIAEAVQSLKPAWLIFAEDLSSLRDLVNDTRVPIVTDHGLRLIQAIDANSRQTLGTLVAWANHPETLWSDNLLITSDFPHFVRENMEKGIYHDDSLIMAGLGGITIYINGAIGGLMTTPPDFEISDPVSGEVYSVPSFEKARAQGKRIALTALHALHDNPDTLKTGNLSLIAKTIDLPLKNNLFRLGASLGILNRGTTGWMNVQSEVSVFLLGPASFITLPGEIYPEIINGGIEGPPGQDFEMQPQEIPAIRNMMPGKYKFVFGMSNDMIGYIIPKSEWDENPPFLYQESSSPYGEINSLGPETAPIIHRELTKIIDSIQK